MENKTIAEMIEEIAEATNDNEHTKARMILARLIGRESLISDLNEVNETHIKDGHMTEENMRHRDMIEKTLLKRARTLYPDYIKAINSAL